MERADSTAESVLRIFGGGCGGEHAKHSCNADCSQKEKERPNGLQVTKCRQTLQQPVMPRTRLTRPTQSTRRAVERGSSTVVVHHSTGGHNRNLAKVLCARARAAPCTRPCPPHNSSPLATATSRGLSTPLTLQVTPALSLQVRSGPLQNTLRRAPTGDNTMITATPRSILARRRKLFGFHRFCRLYQLQSKSGNNKGEWPLFETRNL